MFSSFIDFLSNMILNQHAVDLLVTSLRAWNWQRKVKSHFGISTDVIAELWNRLENCDLISGGFNPKHLVWTLHCMKVCPAWEGAASKLGCNEKTARRWILEGTELVSRVELARAKKLL